MQINIVKTVRVRKIAFLILSLFQQFEAHFSKR